MALQRKLKARPIKNVNGSILQNPGDMEKILRWVDENMQEIDFSLDSRLVREEKFLANVPEVGDLRDGEVKYYDDTENDLQYRYTRIDGVLFPEVITPGFQEGSGITIEGGGGGGGGLLKVSLDIDGLTEESGITDGDFIPFHDTNVGEDRKVDFTDFEAALVAENLSTAIPANRVVLSDGSNLTSDADLVFDGNNLGIGTSSPIVDLHVEDVGGSTSVLIKAGSSQSSNAYLAVWDASNNNKFSVGAFGRIEIGTDQTNYSSGSHRHRHTSSGSFITFDSAGININDIFRALGTAFRIGNINDPGANEIFNITSTTTNKKIARWKMVASQTADNLTFLDASDNELWGMSLEGYQAFKPRDNDTGSIAKLTVGHNINTGTPAAGCGSGVDFQIHSSTTEDTLVGTFSYEWATATHASRKGLAKWIVYDTAAREAIRVEASGSAAMIGFFGVPAVGRQAALTTALTQITHTSPGTPDYAIQDLVDSGAGSAFGFATKDEGNTILSVILNLQTRVDELETRIQNYGLLN